MLMVLLAISLLSSCNASRKSIVIEEGWDLIGEKMVDFVKDKDVIMVNSNNQYTDIRFRIEHKNIRLKDFAIVFQNGDRLTPVVEKNYIAGDESKIIHLAMEGKFIRSINFNYRSKGSLFKGRANVLVFGRRLKPYY